MTISRSNCRFPIRLPFPLFRLVLFILVSVLLILLVACEKKEESKSVPEQTPIVETKEKYPQKPITLIAPWGRGGASDKASRILATISPQYLQQPLIVENRTGNGGLTGADYVHKAMPDGYTLLLARIGCITGPASFKKEMPFRYNDFTMLGLIEINPLVLVVSSDSPYRSLEDLIQEIKQKKNEIKYSTSGKGNVMHLSVLKLMDLADITNSNEYPTPVVYHGGGGVALQGLLDGETDFYFANINTVKSALEKKELRPLLVNAPTRHDLFPDVVTTNEMGYGELGPVVGWSAIFGPPNMDPVVVEYWQNILQEIKTDSLWIELTGNEGSIPMVLSGSGTEKFVEEQYQILTDLIEKLELDR